jgi:hypothetical protein
MAPELFAIVGLQIGWGPTKSELDLPYGCDPDGLDFPRGKMCRPLPHLVQGMASCLGFPRHRSMCAEFVTHALQKIYKRHDGLAALVVDACEDDPLAALRLLHFSGVHKFGYILLVKQSRVK